MAGSRVRIDPGSEWVRVVWRMRVESALRTAVACAVVGGATLYGPGFIRDQIKFVTFSYLTAALIVSDATWGDAARGCWHAFCATAQVVPAAMAVRWAVAEVGIAGAAGAMAGAAFLVALPEGTHLTAKRIAFGQIVLVCTDAVVSEYESVGYMHPVYVAASTALGALASAVALLIPYPDLASNKIRKLCCAYAENAAKRMTLYLRALGASESRAKKELLSQAKPLVERGAKLLHSIRNIEEGIQWERPWRRYSKPNLESMELQLRGIKHSLESTSELTVEEVDQETLSNILKNVSVQVEQRIEQIRCFSPFKTISVAEMRGVEKLSLPSVLFRPSVKHGWLIFYFSCIDMLLNGDVDTYAAQTRSQPQHEKENSSIFGALKAWVLKIASKERLEFALKCSLSLGLAVLFGLIYDKRNGCWAGLTIAISFVTGKQAIFTVANTRAQGTAIGSIYGVICCFLFHYEVLKLLALLPWVIFSSFLRYSKMYGQSGGISAAIGALLILGRKNYGAPNEFALARVTEVFIGLSTFIVVELCLQPMRAAELAKNNLCTTLSSLQNCIKETRTCLAQRNQTVPKIHELRYKQRKLYNQICELKKMVADAELEPDCWHLPFQASCYHNLVGSLAKIADMLYFIIHNFEILTEESECSNETRDFQQQINVELELCQETVNSSLEYLQNANSQEDSQGQADQLGDLEMGKLQNQENQSNLISEHAVAASTNEEDNEDNKELKERTIQCLTATAFCFDILMKEIDEIEIKIREIH